VDVFDALARARARGERTVLVTVLAVDGDAPSRPGAKLVVGAGTVLAGSLGCSEFDAAGLELAAEALEGGAPIRRHRSFAAEQAHGAERALELFAEPQEPEPAVLVLGANPVARAIAALAVALGRRTVVVAPGGDAAVSGRVEVRADDPVRWLLAAPPGPRDALVVSDHDAPWAEEALRVALASDAAYVGMLGSRRHAPQVVRRLRAAGVPPVHVARLRSPVGLDIGGRTPEEIALSILAEVVAVEHGRPGGPLPREWLDAPA
jgi:xanthine dehydrogenase accessory factor